ncbi:hypothetical protein [Brachyspira intermedia]|uniref:hypothetical protein n=1 Tax=Brachyspira intermedia TaxID=84377 RepID=UPI003006C34C
MKIDFNLIKDILEFIHNSSSYQIIGSHISQQFGVSFGSFYYNEDFQDRRANFINHIQLLYDNKCLGITCYPIIIEDLYDNYIRIMPNGYELLYILNNYNIEEEINKNIPISIIIKKYQNEILKK